MQAMPHNNHPQDASGAMPPAPGKDLVFREWQVANRQAHGKEQALAQACLRAIKDACEWPTEAMRDEVKRLRYLADDLFQVAMAQIDQRARHHQKVNVWHTEPTPATLGKVLIIDDNPDLTDTMVSLLNLMGFDTLQANDGLSGVALAVKERPDVVLMDFGLPDISGKEAARRIVAQCEGDCPILFGLSGLSEREAKPQSEGHLFQRYFTKPVAIDELATVLNKAVEQRRTRRLSGLPGPNATPD